MKRLACILMLLLAGCEPVSGQIVGKHVQPSRVFTTTVMVGKVPVVQVHRVPERYILEVSKHGKIRSVSVPKDYYQTAQFGEWYDDADR